MITLCKKGIIDYIIADEPKRLSRNNIDTSRIIDLMDKKLIKWVITTSREYYTEHPRDKFFLQFDLALSKMDNEDRAKDIKAKMITCLKKGQWVSMAPDGYKNVIIRKWHKDIIIDTEVAPHIKKMYKLRCEWYSISKIADILFEDGFKSKKWWVIHHEQINRKLANKFYMWIMVWWWEEYEWKHEPLVSKSVFYKANNIVPKMRYSKRNIKYAFTWYLKDTEWNPMRGNMTKGHIYYMHSTRSKWKLNISEKKILQQAHTLFKGAEFPDPVKKISLNMLDKIFSSVNKADKINKEAIQEQVLLLKDRKGKLVDSFLDGDIEKALYKSKMKEIDTSLAEQEEKFNKNSQISREKLKDIKEKAELVFSLYSRESEINLSERLRLLKSLKAQLFITTKKELQIANSKLLETLKKLNLHVWYSKARWKRTIEELFDTVRKNEEIFKLRLDEIGKAIRL